MTNVGPNAEIAAASTWRVDLRGVGDGIEPRLGVRRSTECFSAIAERIAGRE
jgi:hypothetical protein